MVNGKSGRSWGVFLVLFFMVWCVSLTKQSIAASVPGFVSVGPHAFRPMLSTSYTFWNRLINNAGFPVTFVAPVQLPHGATITQVILYYIDNGDDKIRLRLQSCPLTNPTYDNSTDLISMESTGASSYARVVIGNSFPNGNIIDNEKNSYVILIDLPSTPVNTNNYAVGGVRIDYAYSVNLPAVMK